MRAFENSAISPRGYGARTVASIEGVAIACLTVATLVYFARAITLAASAPLWMDEVLSLWTASEPSVAGVWSALVHGSEFSPPTFDLLLHGLRDIGLTSPLAMRAPSIIAIFVAALGVFALVRRRATTPLAALACAAVLGGGAFAYAIEARPYACSTAAITWAVVAWDRSSRAPTRGVGTPLVVGSLCALAIAFHFYAVILVGLLGLAELSRFAVGRSPRPSLLVAIALGAATILFWWPIAHAAAAWNSADTAARDFYARPTAMRLLASYVSLSVPLVPAFLAAAAALLLLGTRTARPRASGTDTGVVPTAIGGVACLVPLVVFVFALLVTHAYSERYVIVAALGFAVLLSCILRPLGDLADIAALGLLIVVTLPPPSGGQVASPARAQALALVRGAPADLPIATGDGLRFLELIGNGPGPLASRLVFLRVNDPPGGGDPTNRHQVERWAAMRPSLSARDAAAFVCATPRFLMFHDAAGGHDDLPAWLSGVATVHWLQRDNDGLALVEPRPCATRAGKDGQ